MGTLILHLDDDLLHRAEAFSEKTGRSLPEVIEDFLADFGDMPRSDATPAEPESPTKVAHPAKSLAQHQYDLASRHPGEFVVLVGDQVVFHSADRQAAFEAYDRALVDFPSGRPVIVDPGRRLRRRPIVRGRALKRARSARNARTVR